MSITTDTEKCRKILAWLLRAFKFNHNGEHFVPINDVITKYKKFKRNTMYNDAKFCLSYQPKERDHHSILHKIVPEIVSEFLPYYRCAICNVGNDYCKCNFDDKFERFLNKNVNYNILSEELILKTVNEFPAQFIIKNNCIRTIRSWEKNNKQLMDYLHNL
jgi:hypothetical protein